MRKFAKEIVPELNGKEIDFFGWVHEARLLGGISFLVLKDRTGFIQVTALKKEAKPELFRLFSELTKESFVSVKGKVQANKQAPNGVELIPSSLEIISKASTPLPLDTSGKIESDLSVRLDNRYLDIRNPKSIAIFQLRAKIARYCSDYFEENNFINVQTPKLTEAGLESGSEMFAVKYYDKTASLAQSPQLYKQMLIVAGFEKVYEIAPVFRAEKSHTVRHLTEFTGIDFEMANIKDFNDVMDEEEKMVKFMLEKMLKHKDLYGQFNIEAVIPKKIPRIKMGEAKTILKKEFNKSLGREDDLDAEAEKLLGDHALKEFGSEFVFVTNYPWGKRPFYHMKDPQEPDTTLSFDLLWKGTEMTTGSQREHRLEILLKQAKEKGLQVKQGNPYFDMFKYGPPAHGGAGNGLDRMTKQFLGIENIRECILFPRDPERLTP
jgi:aspartyl-tRNA synthetase